MRGVPQIGFGDGLKECRDKCRDMYGCVAFSAYGAHRMLCSLYSSSYAFAGRESKHFLFDKANNDNVVSALISCAKDMEFDDGNISFK